MCGADAFQFRLMQGFKSIDRGVGGKRTLMWRLDSKADRAYVGILGRRLGDQNNRTLSTTQV
jgi:hypothetical protein